MGILFNNNERNENENHNINNNDNENLLVNQDNQIENQNDEEDEETIVTKSIDTLYIKEIAYDQQIDHIKNPILLLKDTLSLEQDAISKTKYYLKFNYDSLLNFNCFINFKVKKNPSKKKFN